MGGGSSTSTEPWSGAKPYIEQLYGSAYNLYNTQMPEAYRATYNYVDPTTGKTYSEKQYNSLSRAFDRYDPAKSSKFWEQGAPPVDPSTLTRQRVYNAPGLAGGNADVQQAMSRWRDRATGGSDLNREAQSGVLDTLRGSYMSPESNPWLEQTYNRGAQDITNRVGHEMALAGRGGSGAHQNLLQQGLSDLHNQTYGQNYQAERGRQHSLYGLAPEMANADYGDIQQQMQLGSAIQKGEQAMIDADRAAWDYQQNQPFQHLAQYAGMMTGIPISFNSTTSRNLGVTDILPLL